MHKVGPFSNRITFIRYRLKSILSGIIHYILIVLCPLVCVPYVCTLTVGTSVGFTHALINYDTLKALTWCYQGLINEEEGMHHTYSV